MTNEEIYQRAGETRSFLETLKTRKAKSIGCIQRYNNLLGRIIEGTTEGKNTRGTGQPPDYVSQIVRDTDCRSCCELKRNAEKRHEWKTTANQSLGC